ncbi:MAG: glycosyltransferase [Candidatus Bathyarchaeota archaeon]|nr:MAG: glycosyltransferase [Candidatus Bathyarchaeota archaeon]
MVNDCAFVGETLLKYLPNRIERYHLKRTRSLWSKTFGIAYRIYKAKGDIYHVNYLLQDCYIALKFGKHPIIGHAHGSDLRTSLNHFAWGRLVRHNLMNCDKIVVSTPDILSQAKNFREDAEYLPNPVDPTLFYPKPFLPKQEKTRVLIASDSDWRVKGTDVAIQALSRIKEAVDVGIIEHGRDFNKTLTLAASQGLKLTVLPKALHGGLPDYFWSHDVVIDRFKLGSLGMVALEAIACGRPVIAHVSSAFPEYKDFPLKDVNTAEKIATVIGKSMDRLWRDQYAYLTTHHAPDPILRRLLDLYESVM